MDEELERAAALADPLHREWTRRVAAERLFGRRAPLTVGRYELERPLGAGGMGVVFLARDPVLRRSVAIKLAHPRLARSDRTLEEARALARLSHPNVLPIYEVGSLEGRAYLVLEHVEGTTLAQWLVQKRRTTREILRMFDAAAAGLAAAHRERIVHRDFKPSNVLIAEGEARGMASRILLADFGLGLAVEDEDDGTTQRGTSGGGSGTAQYMAPEQHRGERCDTRADQYSFCVALYEALWGLLPFAGPTRVSLVTRKMMASIQVPPTRRDLFVVIRRGLSPRAEDRYASMDALRLALAGAVRSRRRTVVMGIAVAGFSTVGALMSSGPCEPADTLLAWNAQQREEIARARQSRQLGFEAVARQIDGYSRSWEAAASRLCEFPEAREVRNDCLMRQRLELSALLQVLSSDSGDSISTDNAIVAVERLESPSRCLRASPEELASLPTSRERAEIIALDRLGRKAEAQAAAERAERAAVARGDLRMAARHRLSSARLQAERGQASGTDPRAPARMAEDVYWTAVATKDDVLATEAAMLRLWIHHAEQAPYPLTFWEREAFVRLARLPRPSVVGADILLALCVTRGLQQHKEGRVLCARTIAEYDAVGQHDLPNAATARTTLADIMGYLGEEEEAVRLGREALAILEKRTGPQHAGRIDALEVVFRWTYESGDVMTAVGLGEQILALKERLWGRRSRHSIPTLGVLAEVYATAGDPRRGRDLLAQALEISVDLHGDSHETTGYLYAELASYDAMLGLAEEARAHVERGIVILEAATGRTTYPMASALSVLGKIEWEAGRLDVALPHLEEAASICEALFDPEHMACIGLSQQAEEVRRDLQRHHEKPRAPSSRPAATSR